MIAGLKTIILFHVILVDGTEDFRRQACEIGGHLLPDAVNCDAISQIQLGFALSGGFAQTGKKQYLAYHCSLTSRFFDTNLGMR